jgi:anti-anti-sigma regulatory factor
MALSEAAADLLRTVLARERAELIERATDVLFSESIDLTAGAPRAPTRALVELVIESNEAVLLAGDDEPLGALVVLATSFRSQSEFHVSTVLRGFRSFRRVVEDALRRTATDGWTAFDVLAAIDELYARTAFTVADVYVDKLMAAIQQRRHTLEEDLAAERAALIALSSPVLPVWPGIVVTPIIGAITAERAGRIEHEVLHAVAGRAVSAVLFDLTGIEAADEETPARLVRIASATRLLGAESLLVGIGPALAKTLVRLDVDLTGIRTFATLHDGLRAALAQTGYRVARRPPP